MVSSTKGGSQGVEEIRRRLGPAHYLPDSRSTTPVGTVPLQSLCRFPLPPPRPPARAVPPLTPPGPGVLDAPHFFGWVLLSPFQCHLPVGKT